VKPPHKSNWIKPFKITNEQGISYCDIILCKAFDAAIRLGLLFEITPGKFCNTLFLFLNMSPFFKIVSIFIFPVSLLIDKPAKYVQKPIV
jgi:hypothetical protein